MGIVCPVRLGNSDLPLDKLKCTGGNCVFYHSTKYISGNIITVCRFDGRDIEINEQEKNNT